MALGRKDIWTICSHPGSPLTSPFRPFFKQKNLIWILGRVSYFSRQSPKPWKTHIPVIPRYSLGSELIKPCTRHILMRKKIFSELGACLGFVALSRTCMCHDTSPQEKMLHSSVLVGFGPPHFGTHHKFRNELMISTKVPLYPVIPWRFAMKLQTLTLDGHRENYTTMGKLDLISGNSLKSMFAENWPYWSQYLISHPFGSPKVENRTSLYT